MKSVTGAMSDAGWGSFSAVIITFVLINILGGILGAITNDTGQGAGLLFMAISFFASPFAAVWGGIRGARIGKRREQSGTDQHAAQEETKQRKAVTFLANGAIIIVAILTVSGIVLTLVLAYG
ncbi:hypothetical protein ACFL6U_26690 [Planctomycetota bacterium]